jgi:alpha-tubulin suppressor-like RCC1 family protein
VHSNPIPVQGVPGRAQHVAVGLHHACAIVGSGAVVCWGANDVGQLGNGMTGDGGASADQPTPVKVLAPQ